MRIPQYSTKYHRVKALERGMTHRATISGVEYYFRKKGHTMYRESGHPYLHASVTKFHPLQESHNETIHSSSAYHSDAPREF